MWLLVIKSIAARLAFQQLLEKPAVVEFLRIAWLITISGFTLATSGSDWR